MDARDETAWREFVERYGSRIYTWCIYRKLQPTDAEDVMQSVLLRLAKQIQAFDYDPQQSFRGWLRRITENAIKDFYLAAARHVPGKGGSGILALLAEEPAQQELVERLAEAFDLELLDLAKSRARQRVNDTRWLSWQLTAEQGMSGKEAAAQLDISVATVYTGKNQVQKLIREEVERLEEGAARA